MSYHCNQGLNMMLASAICLAPTGKEQEGFAKIVRDMEGAGEEPEAICLTIASAIVDGLRHNNWPGGV